MFFLIGPGTQTCVRIKNLLSLHVNLSSILNLVLRKFLISASQFNIHHYHNFATNAEGEENNKEQSVTPFLLVRLLPKFGVARCHQLNPVTEYNSVSPPWSPQMSILRWFTPVVFYSNVLLKKNLHDTYTSDPGLLTSHHQIFFFIKSRPVKLILANTTEISFLFTIRH